MSRDRTLLLIGLVLILTGLLIAVAAPAGSAPPLRWHSCKVTYTTSMDDPALTAAIRDAERASGVDFQQVRKNAYLKITGTDRNHVRFWAYTRWTHRNSRILKATVTVYQRGLTRNRTTRTNLFRHELGHVLGLPHVSGSDVMNRKVTAHRTATRWRAALRAHYQHCQEG